ncbi:hypothetical protein OEZ86_001340 [Tetradesmus obliquus]|nr:hypothetical protein OEZ86_001340 [Tetradesmus obliquus]
MAALWVFEAPVEELRRRLVELQAAADGHARHLVQLIQEELAERDSHAAFEGLILPLLQNEEALQELQQLQLAAPQLHSPAAAPGNIQQHHHSQSKQGQADVKLTPLQAAQRAFLEEQQRVHKARAALHRPALVHGRRLDSWRDWDAMAGSMDEEGGSGFGAWAGAADD